MKFDSKLDLKPWVKPVGHAGQQQVDQVVASFRAGEKALSIKGAATETPSLQLVSSTLDQICERLARAPAVTVECGEDLLRLDVVAQSLRRIAGR